jgi:uncharacterized protein YnzC (UPF0291/DUF896 family)
MTRDLTPEEFMDLAKASNRLLMSADELECALGTITDPEGRDATPDRWKQLRIRLEQEIIRFKQERGR